MRCLLGVAVSAFGLFALAQTGGFGPQVPANGGPMPSYFSGTNRRASGYAQLGEPILFAFLRLNDELVAYYEYQPNDPEPLHAITLEVMFDSSHWMDGTEVEVKFGVYGARSGWQIANGTSVVRNKGMLWQHPDPNINSDPVLIAESLLTNKNYTLDVQNGGSWTVNHYLSMMGGSNLMFYAGHGSASMHLAGDYGQIRWTDYEERRIDQIDGGAPLQLG